MKRLIAVIAVAAGLLGAGLVTAWSAELKVLQTQRTKDAVIALKSETGQWKQGKNAFVLEKTGEDLTGVMSRVISQQMGSAVKL